MSGARIRVFAVYRGEEIVGAHRLREDAERAALAIAENTLAESAVLPMWMDVLLAKALLSACAQ